MTRLLHIAILVVAIGSISQISAQKYVDASTLTIVGKAMPTAQIYHRIDTTRFHLDPASQRLFCEPAGIAIAFTTNSSNISARWRVSTRRNAANLTAIAEKGLDLYIKRDGKWIYAGVGIPKAEKNEGIIVANMDSTQKECLLYLPIYDELFSLEIGVDNSATIEAGKQPFSKKIVIYGSSITQGASASRAGMTYPALLSRRTGFNFVNMGVSGNGKMQPEAAPMIAQTDPDAFILDCMANPSAQLIAERTLPFIKVIRERHATTPIILIQTVVRETGNFNQTTNRYEADKRRAAREVVELIRKEGIGNFYFIDEPNLLGTDHNGTIDGSHPNDLGFSRMVDKLEPQIMKILKNHCILP